MKKVTGIGGIFFKCKNPEAMKDWYNKHLGLQTDAYGTNFEWAKSDATDKKSIYTMEPFFRR